MNLKKHGYKYGHLDKILDLNTSREDAYNAMDIKQNDLKAFIDKQMDSQIDTPIEKYTKTTEPGTNNEVFEDYLQYLQDLSNELQTKYLDSQTKYSSKIDITSDLQIPSNPKID